MSTLFTIGFTKKDARTFFGILVSSKVKTILDVRLNNVSQLAAFTKRDDLKYFLELHHIGYHHLPVFAPTQEILDGYKKHGMPWSEYESKYARLLEARKNAVLNAVASIDLDRACLLCSEAVPENCHRRLAAEWLKSQGVITKIVHL